MKLSRQRRVYMARNLRINDSDPRQKRVRTFYGLAFLTNVEVKPSNFECQYLTVRRTRSASISPDLGRTKTVMSIPY
jgi:hypothetical protein